MPATTEAVYRVMLDKPTADLDELAAHVGLSAEAARAELTVLAELMLVSVGPEGCPFFAIPPEQALEVLLAAEEARISECQRRVGRAREDLGELVDAFVASRSLRDSAGFVEQIDDPSVVTSRLFQLARSGTRKVSFMLPGDAVPAEAIGPSARLDNELLSRGIPLRAIVSDTSLESRHWRDHLTGQAGRGVQVRSHPAPPQRLVIVDESVAIVSRAHAPGALVMKDPDLVAPITALFDAVWHASAPVLAERTPAAEGEEFSDARVRQVVALLAQGQKDEAIARRLQVSVRTVRRLVSASLTTLHAESRFEAGVIAVRRGWVS
ncbi:helix-turn-helix domain-containing protein [Terrabacter sp. BE26]|uniref:helix-turn-helix transcriptional regulator n=1 Tax=Terrabacter sp. BE26 TaxID=2898152 RepID=UPI0035BE1057